MNFWNKNDLQVMELREKIIELTEEFDKKNRKDIENYDKKLEQFLNRRLKRESSIIFKQQINMIFSNLIETERFIY